MENSKISFGANIENEDEKNRKVIFITEQGQFEYQVFAVYQVEKENYDTTINFNSDKQFMTYIENAQKKSVYNFNLEKIKLNCFIYRSMELLGLCLKNSL